MEPASPLTCRELVELLGDYYDGDLPRWRRAPLDEHLRCCPSCVAYAASYRTTIRLVALT